MATYPLVGDNVKASDLEFPFVRTITESSAAAGLPPVIVSAAKQANA